MPEYLAPGVFVEETSFRPKTIEGVSTSTTGFVGPARFGPARGEPALLTSFLDFERIYGGIDRLTFVDGAGPVHNDLAHAVRAYFEEGGSRLYVARAYNEERVNAGDPPALQNGRWDDGIARWTDAGSPAPPFALRARHPGEAGELRVTFAFKLSNDVLDTSGAEPELQGAQNFDVVYAQTSASPDTGDVYWAERYFDEAAGVERWRLRNDDPANDPPVGEVLLGEVESARILTVSVLTQGPGRFDEEQSWTDLRLHPDPADRRSLSTVFAAAPTRRSTVLYVPLVVDPQQLDHGAELAAALLEQPNLVPATGSPPGDPQTVRAALDAAAAAAAQSPPGEGFGGLTAQDLSFQVALTGGSDGEAPTPAQYEGAEAADGEKSGLQAFEDLEDISIVAAPGSTRTEAGAEAVMRALMIHCERMRYRVCVLDSVLGQILGDVRALKGRIDSTRAALYYPWVRIFDPVTESEILQPPSGFVAGIYARTDVDRGVHKSPANEVVRLALGFELLLNRAQQEVLNPEGINCLRFFEGRGYRVWGARTTSSDPEWKYLNVRRYFAYLERSIDRGTQWAVFENNGDVLWANVRRTVEDFLFNEWSENRLFGRKPEEAFFVRCDRTTMSQNDIDNGRLICLVGVAPLRPAEFVIFRIGQKTADAQS